MDIQKKLGHMLLVAHSWADLVERGLGNSWARSYSKDKFLNALPLSGLKIADFCSINRSPLSHYILLGSSMHLSLYSVRREVEQHVLTVLHCFAYPGVVRTG